MKTLVLASILMVAACSKKTDDNAAVVGAGASEGAVELAEAANAACKVLARADAEAWVGHALDQYKGRPKPVGFDCTYSSKQLFSSVAVLLYTSNGADHMQKQKNAKLFGEAPVAIPGVGTEAVRSPDNTVVGVVVGDKLAYVMAVTDKPTAEASERLAKSIASHM
ncbi:hypothetical protein BH11MYX1_BH11MYX1_54810 [soil metagenome]